MYLNLPWSFEPGVVLGLGVAAAGYIAGLLRIPVPKCRRVFGVWRVFAFAAGIGTLALALFSPLDALADRSFAAHMVQHMLLMLVAPPLLVASRPALAWLWAFPLAARRALGRFWAGSGLQSGFDWLMQPLCVWLLASAALCLWHLPGPYQAALTNDGVHTLDHFCLFATSLMFWSLVIEPYGRRHRDYGTTMLMVAAFSVEMGMIGAVLSFASQPLYALGTAPPWGWTRLDDQQLAGLIMWVPTSVVHTATLTTLFLAWLRSAERRAVAAAVHLAARLT